MKEHLSPERSRRGNTVAALALAVTALAGCKTEVINKVGDQQQVLVDKIKHSDPVRLYSGNLICIDKSGASEVVINPLIAPKNDGSSESDPIKAYDFYALVANSNHGHTSFRLVEINLNGYKVTLTKADTTNPTEQAVIKSSDKELLNSPTLFNVNANSSHSTYGYNMASFDYHTVGDTYFTSTAQATTPVAVLLEGQAVSS